jgi:hypothetical protein
MSGDLKHKEVNLHEFVQRGAVKDDIVIRIEEGKRLERLQLEAIRLQRRRKFRMSAALFLSALTIMVVGFLGYRGIISPFNGVTGQPSPAPPVATGVILIDKKINNEPGYQIVKATLSTPDYGAVQLYVYNFYANTFLKDKDLLTQPEKLENVLRVYHDEDEPRKRMAKSWVLIFAGASCEGTNEHNLKLSNDRVEAVTRRMMNLGIRNQGYWGIRAGEYIKVPSEELYRCRDGQIEPTDKAGKEWLEQQRHLVVAVITPQITVPPDQEDRAINLLADSFYELGFLRDEYQYTVAPNRTSATRSDLKRATEPTPTPRAPSS